MRKARVAPPTSAGSVTGIPGKTTKSSRGTNLRFAIRGIYAQYFSLSIMLSCTILSWMKSPTPQVGEALPLLLRLFFAQRAKFRPLAAELELSPAQCQVPHVIEPEPPIPRARLAETLAYDAPNDTAPGWT